MIEYGKKDNICSKNTLRGICFYQIFYQPHNLMKKTIDVYTFSTSYLTLKLLPTYIYVGRPRSTYVFYKLFVDFFPCPCLLYLISVSAIYALNRHLEWLGSLRVNELFIEHTNEYCVYHGSAKPCMKLSSSAWERNSTYLINYVSCYVQW